jgi:hypothetical protein
VPNSVFRAVLVTFGRRDVLAGAIGAAFLLLLGVAPGHSGVAELAKSAAWRLGNQLSPAALLYAQGNQEDKVEQLLSGIKPLAEAMEVEIKPLPPRAATSAETYATVIHYLIEGDGAEIGRAISAKFGDEAGTLYEVSVKSNLLILLYQAGDDQGIGGVIKSRMTEIGLPENLWDGRCHRHRQ